MQWNDFCYSVAMMSVSGSAGSILYLLSQKAFERVGIKLTILKVSIGLFLIPIVYPVLCLSLMRYFEGEWVLISAFGSDIPSSMKTIFEAVMFFWLAGLMIGVTIRGFQYLRFRRLLRCNEPVENCEWIGLIQECSKRYNLGEIQIYQNSRLLTPIVTGIRKPMIVLPYKTYDTKQMYMMVEHELYHIHNRDLLWKHLAMWCTWLHWFNPFSYWILERLIIDEEINCDLAVCDINPNYTTKEYGQFLYEAEVSKRNYIFGSSLVEGRSALERRLIAMTKKRKMKSVSKKVVTMISVAFILCSVIPVFAMGEGLVMLEENWRASVEMVDPKISSQEMVLFDDPGAENEVYVEEGMVPYSATINVDYPIAGNSRYYYRSEDLVVGDTIVFAIRCDDPDATFLIGIKNEETGVLYCMEGTGMLGHTFYVTVPGPYRAVLENKSDNLANFSGVIMYPEE